VNNVTYRRDLQLPVASYANDFEAMVEYQTLRRR
jgi:hypothetical protein